MNRHQKGPWKIISRSGGCCRIGTDVTTIATIGGRGDRQALGDARRIVDCVNACEGLTLAQVEKAIKTWKAERTPDVTCRGTRSA